MLEKHAHSVFASGSKRFETEKEEQLDVGKYDLTHEDIGARVSRYQKMAKQLE